jgi:hypothetical protein
MLLSDQYCQLLAQALTQHPTDVYQQLNALRNAFNALPNTGFDLYLEDNWNDPTPGQTHFEYRLRSLKTKYDIGPIGIDVYKNHQDANGVWHLDDYVTSFWCQNPPQIEIPQKDYAILSVAGVLPFLDEHIPPISH